MLKSKKTILIIISVMLLVSMISGCGGKPVNIALGKTATSDQFTVATEDATLAVDGKTENNSKWCSVSSDEKWLMLDLGQKYDIGRYVIKHAGNGGESPAWNTRDWKLQKSDDALTWVDVEEVTGNELDVTDRKVDSFNTQYVRLLVTYPTQGDTDFAARIFELELYEK